jgi:glutamate synthase domain-containing protein 2
MNALETFVGQIFFGLALLFVAAIGLVIVTCVIVYFIDVRQTTHAIRRNYPVIGRFRYWFEHLGEFFRQYFFAMDREEMPFNRAQRSWAYRAAKGLKNTLPFGSTRDLRPEGTIMFVNSAFPPLSDETMPAKTVVVGEGYCKQPYSVSSVINISGMSYGAISKPAVQALSHGAKLAGCWMNTGEGGLSKFHLEGGCDIVFQLGTGKYGVRDAEGNLSEKKLVELAAHEEVKMFEIKLSQGAKPGKGGILPAEKVSKEIADIRGIPEGEPSISPNRHIELENNQDLLDMIAKIRTTTGKPTGFKAVISDSQWMDDLFALINKNGIETAPDFIVVDGAEGGTGAAPMSLMDDVGLTLKESLPMLLNKLIEHGLRERVFVMASGKLINPTEVAWALCMGADFITTARGPMFSFGCIQALQCNRNTCPTGITTHDKDLQKGLVVADKKQRVANYVSGLEKEIRVIANSCGVKQPRELNRRHARIVVGPYKSMTLAKLFPEPAVKGKS